MSIKIGNWELRSPLARYVEISIEEDIYLVMRKAIIQEICKELKQW